MKLFNKTTEEVLAESTGTIDPEPGPQRKFHLRKTFTALKYRNYRLWFFGQMASLMGTWMQITAQGFLVYDLTHSPVYLGYVGFAAGLPSWLFMLYAGVIADRLPKRKVMIYTQSAMMILAAILAVMAFLNIIQPWEIIIFAFLLGTANAFDAPSRISLVNELVEREDLTNAIALNATMFNIATATGPAIAGIAYAVAGPAWCFTINSLSFIGILIALKKMRLEEKISAKPRRNAFVEIKEGYKYIASSPIIKTIIVQVGVMSVFGISFITLLPAWAVKILGGDSATNGFLQSARGVGALVSALSIASLGRFNYKGKLLTLGSIAFPLMLFAFSFTTWLPFSLLLLFGVGMAHILTMNLCNATVQTIVPDELRGRVMGFYTFTFFGMMPVGALIMGSLAGHFDSPTAIHISSLITLSVAISIFLFMPAIRRLK
jgi:MFS family permease